MPLQLFPVTSCTRRGAANSRRLHKTELSPFRNLLVSTNCHNPLGKFVHSSFLQLVSLCFYTTNRLSSPTQTIARCTHPRTCPPNYAQLPLQLQFDFFEECDLSLELFLIPGSWRAERERKGETSSRRVNYFPH